MSDTPSPVTFQIVDLGPGVTFSPPRAFYVMPDPQDPAWFVAQAVVGPAEPQRFDALRALNERLLAAAERLPTALEAATRQLLHRWYSARQPEFMRLISLGMCFSTPHRPKPFRPVPEEVPLPPRPALVPPSSEGITPVDEREAFDLLREGEEARLRDPFAYLAPETRVRVVRVVEYDGAVRWLGKQLALSSPLGRREGPQGSITIVQGELEVWGGLQAAAEGAGATVTPPAASDAAGWPPARRRVMAGSFEVVGVEDVVPGLKHGYEQFPVCRNKQRLDIPDVTYDQPSFTEAVSVLYAVAWDDPEQSYTMDARIDGCRWRLTVEGGHHVPGIDGPGPQLMSIEFRAYDPKGGV